MRSDSSRLITEARDARCIDSVLRHGRVRHVIRELLELVSRLTFFESVHVETPQCTPPGPQPWTWRSDAGRTYASRGRASTLVPNSVAFASWMW
jgi:hypothetical protein